MFFIGKLPEKESHFDRKKIVLLDARNLYETRIGKFHSPDVETLDPKIRQYSDLPSWIDSNSDHLRGNSILMYVLLQKHVSKMKKVTDFNCFSSFIFCS